MNDTPRPLTEHLTELRQRLFWALGTWLVFAIVAGYWARDVFEILMLPAIAAVRAKGHTLLAIAPPELFFTYVKSAILAGFVTSLPVILYQGWSFVSPGLYANERRFALPFVLSTFLLFLMGCSFGYFFAFPTVFNWFLSLEADYVTTSWTTQAVFSFVARLYLVFGLAFELPIVIVFLALAGIVTPERLARTRRYAILCNFIAAAILTPADPASQIMLAVPLIVLYEAGIWTARLLVRSRDKAASAETG
ncbi:MAG: twin-arginine translocase subunit TatC [Myxococcota bacterium]